MNSNEYTPIPRGARLRPHPVAHHPLPGSSSFIRFAGPLRPGTPSQAAPPGLSRTGFRGIDSPDGMVSSSVRTGRFWRWSLDDLGMIVMIALLWITAAVLFSSCAATKYETRDPVSGRVLTKFQTRGNIGVVTSKTGSSNSRAGGVPLLNGGYVNNDATTAAENQHTQDVGITFPDGTAIRGTIDHSTPVDVQGQWLWRSLRTVGTALTYMWGFDTYEGIQVAQENTARNAANRAAATNQAEIAARTQQAQIEANKVVQLKELETVPLQ